MDDGAGEAHVRESAGEGEPGGSSRVGFGFGAWSGLVESSVDAGPALEEAGGE